MTGAVEDVDVAVSGPASRSTTGRASATGTSWSSAPWMESSGRSPKPGPSAIARSAATNASSVGRFQPPCHTRGSAAYASPTAGSRESTATSIGSDGGSGAASQPSKTGPSPTAGPVSTSPARSSRWRWA